jgi:hypothetical protein
MENICIFYDLRKLIGHFRIFAVLRRNSAFAPNYNCFRTPMGLLPLGVNEGMLRIRIVEAGSSAPNAINLRSFLTEWNCYIQPNVVFFLQEYIHGQ